jgi:Na+-driven multidrug efflux pump
MLPAVIGGDPAMLGHACQYMYARCIGNPFVLLNFVFIGCCRGLKDAKTPLYAVVLANLSNLLMDVLFVYGLNMGAAGAALATSISQMLSCAILFSAMMQRCELQIIRPASMHEFQSFTRNKTLHVRYLIIEFA